jgi:sodium/potassium/calcium exchanger 6
LLSHHTTPHHTTTQRGASSTALTACFAAPLFNMLMSMAMGFSAYFAKEGVHT